MSDWITQYAEGEWKHAAFLSAKDLEACLRDFNATQQAEIGRLMWEVQAWRATFPIMHVRPGALFASTNIEAAVEAARIEGGYDV